MYCRPRLNALNPIPDFQHGPMNKNAVPFHTAKAKFVPNLLQHDTCCNPWCVFKLSDNCIYDSCNMNVESTQKIGFKQLVHVTETMFHRKIGFQQLVSCNGNYVFVNISILNMKSARSLHWLSSKIHVLQLFETQFSHCFPFTISNQRPTFMQLLFKLL